MSVLCVTLRAFVPVPTSYGWAWGPWRGDDPLARECVKSPAELPLLLRSYGSMISTLIRFADSGDRFNVTVYGSVSGLAYGRDQWVWHPLMGRYIAHGEPWVPRMEEAQRSLHRASNVVALPSPDWTSENTCFAA